MKKLIVLPLVTLVALGLSACTKHSETENVTVNETSLNVEAPAVDANLTENAADATLDNTSNAADALTNG
ncbi:MAG TPA: hypothetical protein VNT42_00855 [Sphingomonas sp.]|nr:hypothetical protein [Sphingomonas sp.]